jgi:hypothetical protein
MSFIDLFDILSAAVTSIAVTLVFVAAIVLALK